MILSRTALAAAPLCVTGLLLLVACDSLNPPPPAISLVEVQRSAPQRLVLTNDRQQPYSVVPAAGGLAHTLAPGATLPMPFEVASVASLEAAPGKPWSRLGDTGTIDHLDPPSPWLKQTGPDAELRLHLPDGTFRAVPLKLAGCFPAWADAPAAAADHPLTVDEALSRPAGVPVPLCPANPK